MKKLPNYTISSEVEEVLLICKSHLDIGYTDLAARVRRAYIAEFIPKAIAVARQLHTENGDENFVWNTGSWLVHEYWQHAAPARLREFEQAVADGLIAWHALPFTSHTELYDPELFGAGIELARELDQRFGRHTVAAKMTDVPGHTRGLVSALARHDVRFLHIGVNPSAPAPQIPPLCRWRNGDDEVLLMYAAGDYGADVVWPQYRSAVIFAHGGDNTAPLGVGAVRYLFRQARLQFPRARVRMGSLDDLAALLLPHAADFPVFSGEIGDSWIHGLATDPAKVARFRELSRLRRDWLAAGCAVPPRFDRALLLVGEHTWGMDVKTHLGDDHNWRRADFDAARAVQPNYPKVEASWQEQRTYLNTAVAALPPELRHTAAARWNALRPRRRPLRAPVAVPPVVDTPFLHAEFNRRGELTRLTAADGRRDWTAADRPFFQLEYRRYNRRDTERWYREYCHCHNMLTAAWAQWDLGKAGLPEDLPSDGWRGERARFQVTRHAAAVEVAVRIAMPSQVVTAAGCPAHFEILYSFALDRAALHIDVQWFDKAANRMPEAIFAHFGTCFGPQDRWVMNKFGTAVMPHEVVAGGGRNLHAVAGEESLVIDGARGRLRLDSPDAPLLLPGACRLWRFPDTLPELERGFHFCLYNNQWGTNFPMWYDDDARFRFQLTWTGE